MEVEIISREIIKPATLEQVPQDDPKTFQVSLLDMASPLAYIPIIFFYSMIQETDNNSHFIKENAATRLKISLSKTLAHFPILTGKIKGNLIHCSNEDEEVGALFVEAKVHKVTMANFLKNPNLQFLPQFLPFPAAPNEPLERTIQIGAQVSFFSCGGIAIGFSFLHKIIDGTTMSSFIKSLAAAASNNLVCGGYQYSTSSLFPAREISDDYNLLSSKTPFVVAQGKSSTSRRFVFDSMAISNLKARTKSTRVLNPTTVEVVTCFIWKYVMKASRRCRLLDCGDQNFVNSKWGSTLIHMVNMRRRMQPPLSDNEVGNIYWRSSTYYEASNDTVTTLDDLESLLRRSLSKIDKDSLQNVMGDEGFETLLSSFEQLHEVYEKSDESYLFTSWRNMGFNEVNFGWGKPVWNACAANTFNSMLKNIIILMDTAEGLEAWVLLDDETMNLLENDDEFLEFASPNPSISHLRGIKMDE